MLRNFKDLQEKACAGRTFRLCIAAAEDAEILDAVAKAVSGGFVEPVLVGDASVLQVMAQAAGLSGCRIVPTQTPAESAAKAVSLVRSGEADVLMKGLLNTSDYMRAILDKEAGLRSGNVLSTLAVYEVPQYHKLIFCTDSGINVAPDLERKKALLRNALGAMRLLGIAKPKVAALAANEAVDPKIPATTDGAALAEAARNGEFGDVILEGPVAFDVAFDKEAARHKKIDSKIAGETDLILAPNIETGNALGKSWLTLNKAEWAGVVLGAARPVVLGSRSDTAAVKINSIALACLLAGTQEA